MNVCIIKKYTTFFTWVYSCHCTDLRCECAGDELCLNSFFCDQTRKKTISTSNLKPEKFNKHKSFLSLVHKHASIAECTEHATDTMMDRESDDEEISTQRTASSPSVFGSQGRSQNHETSQSSASSHFLKCKLYSRLNTSKTRSHSSTMYTQCIAHT